MYVVSREFPSTEPVLADIYATLGNYRTAQLALQQRSYGRHESARLPF